jgi:hypothetical protein
MTGFVTTVKVMGIEDKYCQTCRYHSSHTFCSNTQTKVLSCDGCTQYKPNKSVIRPIKLERELNG